ncbi:MAG TPA: hypothetical protein PLD56_02775 [Chitinophagales bacterium]|nr:hypothetical protein [Chitinophagales bacterium]
MKQLHFILPVLLFIGISILPTTCHAQFGKVINKVINKTVPNKSSNTTNDGSSNKTNNNSNNSDNIPTIKSNSPIPENEKYNCQEKEVSNGYSSEVHKKYSNKLVFSKTEIVMSNQNEATFSNTFTLKDNIYSRIYLSESPVYTAQTMGLCCKGGLYCMKLFYRYIIDNKETNNQYAVLSTPEPKKITWQLGISPSKEDVNSGYPLREIYKFKDLTSELSEGTHKIRVEYFMEIPDDDTERGLLYSTKFGKEIVLASGEFTLQVKTADKTEMKEKLYVKPAPVTYSSSSSNQQSCYVDVKNGSGESIKFDLYTSASRTTESLSSNSNKSIDCNMYEKIVITDGRCKDVTYYLKGMAGKYLTLCGK